MTIGIGRRLGKGSGAADHDHCPSQLLKLKYLGLGGSGIDMNTSEVQSMLPHLKYHGDHYRHESFTPEMSHSYNTWCI
jgi:hypothetical protein